MRRVRGVHATTASHAAVACASARRASARATLFARRSRLFIALATLTTLHFSDSKRAAISGACAVAKSCFAMRARSTPAAARQPGSEDSKKALAASL